MRPLIGLTENKKFSDQTLFLKSLFFFSFFIFSQNLFSQNLDSYRVDSSLPLELHILIESLQESPNRVPVSPNHYRSLIEQLNKNLLRIPKEEDRSFLLKSEILKHIFEAPPRELSQKELPASKRVLQEFQKSFEKDNPKLFQDRFFRWLITSLFRSMERSITSRLKKEKALLGPWFQFLTESQEDQILIELTSFQERLLSRLISRSMQYSDFALRGLGKQVLQKNQDPLIYLEEAQVSPQKGRTQKLAPSPQKSAPQGKIWKPRQDQSSPKLPKPSRGWSDSSVSQ